MKATISERLQYLMQKAVIALLSEQYVAHVVDDGMPELGFAQWPNYRRHKLPKATNENDFFKWLLGPSPAFRSANLMRQRMKEYRDPMEPFSLEARIHNMKNARTFLDLFECLYIDEDPERARELAPRLNRCIPNMMMFCPDPELRPSKEELEAEPDSPSGGRMLDR